MVKPQNGLCQKITNIRKSMQMSLHDCARLLGTTTKRYLAFEQGEEALSLPELEILAYYFGIPLIECLEGQANSSMRFSLLKVEKRTAYIHLREKWIRSRINLEIKNKGLKLEELAEVLGVSIEKLTKYRNGDLPIPLNHLQTISAHFKIPLEAFLPELDNNNLRDQLSFQHAAGQWNPEFPSQNNVLLNNDLTYDQLLAALREIPKEDQAELAKALLKKLKE